MANDYLCKLTTKLNELSSAMTKMQANAGLYADASTEATLTGRIKALEETVVGSDPTETNISRMMVEHDVIVDANGMIKTQYWPIGGCVNREVMVQDPNDPEVWEVVGQVTFLEDDGNLHTTAYTGWKATVSYLYAVKITLIELDFLDVTEEVVLDMSSMIGSVYRMIFTITPVDGGDADSDADTCKLKWEDSSDATDYTEETIITEHKRVVDEEEFNHVLKITGSAHVVIEVRNRIS